MPRTRDETARSSAQRWVVSARAVDIDVVTIDLDQILVKTAARRIDTTTGTDIETPHVIGTGQDGAVEFTVDQRVILVWTDAIQGVQGAVPVAHDKNLPALDKKSVHTAILQITDCAYSSTGHMYFLSGVPAKMTPRWITA